MTPDEVLPTSKHECYSPIARLHPLDAYWIEFDCDICGRRREMMAAAWAKMTRGSSVKFTCIGSA